MSKQYAVIGLGKFGFAVATTLAQAGKEVLAVDKDPELVQEIADLVTYAARADITDSRVFASLGISNMDVVIVGIAENMESSILARHRKGHEPDACQYFEKSRRGPRRDGGE